MKKKLLRLLDFCNLLDYNKKISITNIALIALISKIMMAVTIDFPSVVALATVFANYIHRRSMISKEKLNQSKEETDK